MKGIKQNQCLKMSAMKHCAALFYLLFMASIVWISADSFLEKSCSDKDQKEASVHDFPATCFLFDKGIEIESHNNGIKSSARDECESRENIKLRSKLISPDSADHFSSTLFLLAYHVQMSKLELSNLSYEFLRMNVLAAKHHPPTVIL